MQGIGPLFVLFLGFEAIPNMAQEAKNPTRDVPYAIVATLVGDSGARPTDSEEMNPYCKSDINQKREANDSFSSNKQTIFGATVC